MDAVKIRKFKEAMRLGYHKVTTRLACEEPGIVEAVGVTIDDVLEAFTKYNGHATGVYGTHLECIRRLLRAGWKISDDRLREFFVNGHKWNVLGPVNPNSGIGDSVVVLLAEMHQMRPDIVTEDVLYENRVFARMLKLDRPRQRKIARFWPKFADELRIHNTHAT